MHNALSAIMIEAPAFARVLNTQSVQENRRDDIQSWSQAPFLFFA